MKSKKQKALQAIEGQGCLLVFPLQNRKEPDSIWNHLHPRTKMRWEWDENGDHKVADLWHLREELSRSREVIYAKWYQGRATFFSKKVFVHLLAYYRSAEGNLRLPLASQEALDSLLMDSPQSTKLLKENLGWQGRMMESHYNRALKPLWNHLYIVGFGETQDSSFPSLNMAATQTLFEDLWFQSLDISSAEAEKFLRQKLGPENLFFKYAKKLSANYENERTR